MNGIFVHLIRILIELLSYCNRKEKSCDNSSDLHPLQDFDRTISNTWSRNKDANDQAMAKYNQLTVLDTIDRSVTKRIKINRNTPKDIESKCEINPYNLVHIRFFRVNGNDEIMCLSKNVYLHARFKYII